MLTPKCQRCGARGTVVDVRDTGKLTFRLCGKCYQALCRIVRRWIRTG